MNEYEIFCLALATAFVIMVAYFEYKINKLGEKLGDKIIGFKLRDNMIDGKLERLEDDVYALMDRDKKEDTSTNSKACYGHVFNLIKASTGASDEQPITVHTIDDLKAIWDKYGHSNDKIFDTNRLIIDFDENRIIIYDCWVE